MVFLFLVRYLLGYIDILLIRKWDFNCLLGSLLDWIVSKMVFIVVLFLKFFSWVDG